MRLIFSQSVERAPGVGARAPLRDHAFELQRLDRLREQHGLRRQVADERRAAVRRRGGVIDVICYFIRTYGTGTARGLLVVPSRAVSFLDR